jgi:hypothetical protein
VHGEEDRWGGTEELGWGGDGEKEVRKQGGRGGVGVKNRLTT